MGVYGATKYAVEALSDALRQEVAGFGIKVVIIEPGFVATSLGEAADGRPAQLEEAAGAYAAMTAAGDRYVAGQIAKGITPDKVAAAIVAAAEHPSPRTRYVVPGSARALIALLTTLPDKLADRAKQRAVASSLIPRGESRGDEPRGGVSAPSSAAALLEEGAADPFPEIVVAFTRSTARAVSS